MSISNAHIPKLGVVDVINFPRFSNQSLAVEPLIVFPIRLQIGSSWTLKVVPAGSSEFDRGV
jgi:hypothetical protein